jgi:hypothetical protein
LQASTNLAVWGDLGVVTNQTGVVRFDDAPTGISPQKFFRAQSAP